MRLAARYRQSWTRDLATAEAERVAVNEWTRVLAGVDIAGIERALRRCGEEPRLRRLPPTAYEFLALTQPTAEELGLPPLEEAYQAAKASRWREHPIVWQAVNQIGQFEFGRLPAETQRERFAEAYRRLLGRVLQGEVLAFPKSLRPQLGQERAGPATAPGAARPSAARPSAARPGAAQEHLAALRKLLGMPPRQSAGAGEKGQ